MAKISNIAGFPEWLPEEKAVEDELIQEIKEIFESYGFISIETPAVELMTTLTSEGFSDKEIYAIKRAQGDDSDEATLGLHFDLTRPFARYTAQHFSNLTFPFKRYQLQKVWRGERPQKGRFREFYQFDIDTICQEKLPLAADAEVLTVFEKVFSKMNLGDFTLRINNRKVLLGFYSSLGLSEELRKQALIVVDKIHKIGADGVTKELTETLKIDAHLASRIVELSKVRLSPSEVNGSSVPSVKNELFEEGMKELREVVSLMPPASLKHIEVDLSMARGLDYYTGTIFETYLLKYPEFGSVCSGGRYENLASEFINKKLPGVGASIGLTRLMDLVLREKLRSTGRKSKAAVLVTVYSEEQRPRCNEIAEIARAAGIAVEVFLTSPKLGKQIDYADAKGIPNVLFVGNDGQIEIKNLATKEQVKVADLAAWCAERR